MSSNNSSTLSNPPMFTRENYSVWVIKMKAFLKGNGVLESVEDGFYPPMLPNNPTAAKMKQHADYVQALYKALSYIHSAVTDDIFSRIMVAETAQEAWDTFKKEFDGSSRVKDRRVVEKIIVSVLDKFESKISAIEESCDLKELTITKLISKLQAHEQSGCTNHMARDESFFIEMDKSVITNVKLGNGTVVRSQGKDTTVIQSKTGKMHKLPFPVNKSLRATQKLELVHTDICGPMRTPSLSQNRYFILFIDDFTRITWVYFLGSKGQALPVFKNFKALVENQSGCRIKKLRSDNGKEYTFNNFNLFCEEAGVDHQLTVSYTPQQNGIAERKNITVMEMARCMLAEKKLPKSFWAEAVYTAVYLLNGLPTKVIKGMTLIEAWYGQKPSANHLKVFGSICYNHVPATKRGKLDEKVEIGIFIGYATQAEGYKVYDPISKKVNVHKDVAFDESAHWNWDAGKIEKGSNKQCEVGSDVASSSEIAEVDDDSSVLKTKSLTDIYARCNLATAEPNCFEEAAKQQARLVVKGYAQQPGVDYGETYAPVARHDIVRLLIALAANLCWKLFHMDVKLAFLNGVLQEEIYVEQPPRIDHYLMSQGFRRSTEEETLYVKGSSSESQLILSLYVDDLLLTGNDLKLLEQFKKRKYALDILKKFEMENCKPVSTPLVQNERLSRDDQETKVDSSYYRSLIGSLLYLIATRPDLMFAASYLSRFMSAPSKLHLVAAKRVLRYIKGTYELGLWFDSNQQGSSGSFFGNSKKQDVVAQSTAKVEYLAAGVVANHAIWLRMVLEELGFNQIESCVLKVDNMSAIAIAQNPVQHGRTEHIKIKYHVIRNDVGDKEIVLQHCDYEVQVADILTKALPRQKFEEFRDMLGVTNIKARRSVEDIS
ncbi:hypothetical protein SLEP1_g46821 [Rubroshorea leprosula]|uniref:Integrase catalytic domain-containing protein n=1 Tax=Rubroshorea leprosula TaxID=152421 RepID=A0AAV5LNH0_9ROSI|nr:hypothetical protein SLEP1_g46821 [Rubroshorea leprosula]